MPSGAQMWSCLRSCAPRSVPSNRSRDRASSVGSEDSARSKGWGAELGRSAHGTGIAQQAESSGASARALEGGDGKAGGCGCSVAAGSRHGHTRVSRAMPMDGQRQQSRRMMYEHTRALRGGVDSTPMRRVARRKQAHLLGPCTYLAEAMWCWWIREEFERF